MKFPFKFPVKRINTQEKKIFLTFDDGPSEKVTPKVLDLLKNKNAKATFFVVTKQANNQPELIKRILSEGHAIGDHSLDHKYSRYFATLKNTTEWIKQSQSELQRICGMKPVAFRTPAGIWTPKVALALETLQVPWVHWNVRFFDTRRTFTKKLVDKKMGKLAAGSIILLHDKQTKNHEDSFLETLGYLIEQLKTAGFSLEKLPVH